MGEFASSSTGGGGMGGRGEEDEEEETSHLLQHVAALHSSPARSALRRTGRARERCLFVFAGEDVCTAFLTATGSLSLCLCVVESVCACLTVQVSVCTSIYSVCTSRSSVL